VNFNDRDVLVHQGDIYFQDFGQPFSAICPHQYANVTLIFTRNTGPALFRDGSLHGAVLRANEPVARLLHAQMQSLLSAIDELPVRVADAAVLALLSLAATGMDKGGGGALQTGHHVIDRAVAAVRNQIGNPSLKPETIANALGVSRAKLYRLLEPYGGVRNLISRVRLDESLKTLADASPDSVVIADVALRHGFTSAAQFSRAFRARFGRAPREILAMRKANPKAQLYRAWVEARRAQSDFETIDAWLESVTK
jgi:AraC-like DNA-binding protein